MNIAEYAIRFIYPPRCFVCGSLMDFWSEDFICGKCMKNISYAENGQDYGYSLKNKFGINIYFDYGAAVFNYRYVKKSIERLKYNNETYLSKAAAEIMCDFSQKTGLLNNADILVPVPISKKRMKERGYNQAFILADGISKNLGISCIKDVLIRNIDTKPQNLLGPYERIENVKNAFSINNKYLKMIKNKNVVIIDDIFTTGATINECAMALKENGAAKVGFFTLSAAGDKY